MYRDVVEGCTELIRTRGYTWVALQKHFLLSSKLQEAARELIPATLLHLKQAALMLIFLTVRAANKFQVRTQLRLYHCLQHSDSSAWSAFNPATKKTPFSKLAHIRKTVQKTAVPQSPMENALPESLPCFGRSLFWKKKQLMETLPHAAAD